MGIIENFINFILHFDQSLGLIIQQFGPLTYLILFIIIFTETGFVLTPFFPGDSLLFICGTFASNELLKIEWILALLTLAAIGGDTVNYWLGHFVGPKIFKEKSTRFLKKEYLDMAHKFYEKHGGKTIILARFIPIIRTFAPFVAGMGRMKYGHFLVYNIVGGVAWVFIFVLAGYYFGSIPIVKENLSLTIILIIFVSFLPILFKFLTGFRKKM